MTSKSISLIIQFLLFSIYGIAQSTFVSTHEIVRKAQETSLYTKNVDWKKVDARFIEISKGRKDTKSLIPALQYLINELGDKHATIRSTKDYQILASYTGPNKSKDNRKPDYVNNVINDTEAKFGCQEYAFSDGTYGHLNIVAIGGNASVDEEVEIMQNCIRQLKSTGTNKWIVDLRNNGGGNMNPMLAGMAPLFKDGFIGGSMDANAHLVHKYEIKDGNFYDTDRLVYKTKNRIMNCFTDPVAVLTSKYTTSSGELVAVAFKGRPNTIFIGETTAGYTTGNGYDIITEELAMCISQSYFTDRNLVKYKSTVDVDIEIPFIEGTNNMADKQFNKARTWLSKQK